MVAPTVVAIKTQPVQAPLARVFKHRARANATATPQIVAGPNGKIGNRTGTVAGALTITAPLSAYPNATALHATRADGSALPAWLTQDWASNTLTLSKGAGAGVAGVYALRIVAQNAQGHSIFNPFALILT